MLAINQKKGIKVDIYFKITAKTIKNAIGILYSYESL